MADEDVAPAGLRKRLSKQLRYWRYRLGYGPEYRRLKTLEGRFAGRRAFLIGNGPSLGRMDLTGLATEFVCVVNMGLRGVGETIPSADMHVLLDANRYRRFAGEVEALCIRHAVPYRFASTPVMRVWQRQEPRGARPYLILTSLKRLSTDGVSLDVRRGLNGTGPTVLVGAAQILMYMGFTEIYILGCDLDYESGEKYFYALGETDRVHEADPHVIARRKDMVDTNARLAIVRDFAERHGVRLANAGVGGNLTALERVDFGDLMAHRPG